MALNHQDVRRLLNVVYDADTKLVYVTIDDGALIITTLEQLAVPTNLTISNVALDEFGYGVEFRFTDGTMQDVCGDVIKALS